MTEELVEAQAGRKTVEEALDARRGAHQRRHRRLSHRGRGPARRVEPRTRSRHPLAAPHPARRPRKQTPTDPERRTDASHDRMTPPRRARRASRDLIQSLQDAGGRLPREPDVLGLPRLQPGSATARSSPTGCRLRARSPRPSAFFDWCAACVEPRGGQRRPHRRAAARRRRSPTPRCCRRDSPSTARGSARRPSGGTSSSTATAPGCGRWRARARGTGSMPARWRRGIELTSTTWCRRGSDPATTGGRSTSKHGHVSTLGSIAAGLRDAAREPSSTTAALGVGSGHGGRHRRVRPRRDGIRDGHLIKWVGSDEVDASLAALVGLLGVIDADEPAGPRDDRRARPAARGRRRRRTASSPTPSTAAASGRCCQLHARPRPRRGGGPRCARSRLLRLGRGAPSARPARCRSRSPTTCSHPSFVAEWEERWGRSADPLLWSSRDVPAARRRARASVPRCSRVIRHRPFGSAIPTPSTPSSAAGRPGRGRAAALGVRSVAGRGRVELELRDATACRSDRSPLAARRPGTRAARPSTAVTSRRLRRDSHARPAAGLPRSTRAPRGTSACGTASRQRAEIDHGWFDAIVSGWSAGCGRTARAWAAPRVVPGTAAIARSTARPSAASASRCRSRPASTSRLRRAVRRPRPARRRARLGGVRAVQEPGRGAKTYLPMPFAHVVGGDGLGLPRAHVAGASGSTSAPRDAGPLWVEARDRRPTARPDRSRSTTARPAEVLDAFLDERRRRAEELPEWVFRLWASGNEWNTQARVMRRGGRAPRPRHPGRRRRHRGVERREHVHGLPRRAVRAAPPTARRTRLADFEFPADGAWPDPKGMVDELHARGIRVLLWQIPLHQDAAAPRPAGAQRMPRRPCRDAY